MLKAIKVTWFFVVRGFPDLCDGKLRAIMRLCTDKKTRSCYV